MPRSQGKADFEKLQDIVLRHTPRDIARSLAQIYEAEAQFQYEEAVTVRALERAERLRRLSAHYRDMVRSL